MKSNLLFVSFILLIFSLGCKKHEPTYILPPNNFFFQILKDGQRLPDAVLDSMDFYYLDKKGRKVNSRIRNQSERYGEREKLYSHVDELGWYPKENELTDQGVRLSLWILGFKIEHNVWYFEYPDGDIDTLILTTKELNREQGILDACFCNHPISSIVFNGKKVNTHSTLKGFNGKNIYVLEK